VELISRDRDGVNAEGGYDGAPRGKQVADRFHLVQSLIRAVQEELAHQRKQLLIQAAELVSNDSAQKVTAPVPETVSRQPRCGRPPSSRKKEIRQQRAATESFPTGETPETAEGAVSYVPPKDSPSPQLPPRP
jgi:hypothetical protein